MKSISIVFALLTATFILGAGRVQAQNPDKITGVYRVIGAETGEASKVRVYKKGDTYEARIIWLEHPLDKNGKPRTDALNPNPSLRSVRGDNILIVWGLKYDKTKNQWSGGRIYNPVNGKTYDAQAKFDSPTKLAMRGYLGRPSFGKTFIWTKLE